MTDENQWRVTPLWESASPYLAPATAASLSVIPFFGGFIKKTNLQIAQVNAKLSLLEQLKLGCKASPTIGMIVGTQVVAQNIIEKHLPTSHPQSARMAESTLIVSFISSPFLAAFNGQTMGYTIGKTFQLLSPRQVGAIMTREITFLFALRVSGPISENMKTNFKNTPLMEVTSHYFTGVAGSYIGHPADSALTLWQRNIRIVNFAHLMRGAFTKAHTVGKFTVLYNLLKKILCGSQAVLPVQSKL